MFQPSTQTNYKAIAMIVVLALIIIIYSINLASSARNAVKNFKQIIIQE